MTLALLLSEIFALLGYFAIMIGFMIAAICTAKQGALPWVFFFVGAGIQLLSLLGAHKSNSMVFPESWLYWAIYFILLGIPGIIIIYRSSNHGAKPSHHDAIGQQEQVKTESTGSYSDLKHTSLSARIVLGDDLLAVFPYSALVKSFGNEGSPIDTNQAIFHVKLADIQCLKIMKINSGRPIFEIYSPYGSFRFKFANLDDFAVHLANLLRDRTIRE